jgi:hypothetical protein
LIAAHLLIWPKCGDNNMIFDLLKGGEARKEKFKHIKALGDELMK